jgi:GNAT superfamily N-acetyltransferase
MDPSVHGISTGQVRPSSGPRATARVTSARMTHPTPLVRPARPDDVPDVLAMIRELADYERALDQVLATEDRLRATLFADRPEVFCHVAEAGGGTAGFALWFVSYSTWLAAHGLYLEDLYVRPAHRGRGLGRALLRELARVCVARGWPRLDWAVLDWNADARRFYASVGADARTDWVPYRITGAALRALADLG